MDISELPPEVLTMILNHQNIPIQQRIALRRVSTQWCTLIEIELQKVTHLNITEVPAVFASRSPPSEDILVLIGSQITRTFVQQITRLFPHLTSLYLETISKTSYQQLSWLLFAYRTTLNTLDLEGRHHFPRCLVAALNDLTQLSSLRLHSYTFCLALLRALAPTLARIEEFIFKAFSIPNLSHCEFGHALLSLLSDRCSFLEISSRYLHWRLPGIDLEDSLSCLTIREWTTSRESDNILARLCTRFIGLEYLGVYRLRLNTANLRHLVRLGLSTLELFEVAFEPRRLTVPLAADRRLTTVHEMQLQLMQLPQRPNRRTIRRYCTRLLAWFPSLRWFTVLCKAGVDYVAFSGAIEAMQFGGDVSVVVKGW